MFGIWENINRTITIGELLTIVVLIVTFICILVYTYVTYRLWKASQLQTHLQISPYIIFEIHDHKLYLKNMGKSAGLQISLDPLRFIVETSPKPDVYELVFDTMSILEANDRKELTYTTYVNGKEAFLDLSVQLNPKYQKTFNFTFTLLYNNIIGARYFTKFRTGKDGTKILKLARFTIRHSIVRYISGMKMVLRFLVLYQKCKKQGFVSTIIKRK